MHGALASTDSTCQQGQRGRVKAVQMSAEEPPIKLLIGCLQLLASLGDVSSSYGNFTCHLCVSTWPCCTMTRSEAVAGKLKLTLTYSMTT